VLLKLRCLLNAKKNVGQIWRLLNRWFARAAHQLTVVMQADVKQHQRTAKPTIDEIEARIRARHACFTEKLQLLRDHTSFDLPADLPGYNQLAPGFAQPRQEEHVLDRDLRVAFAQTLGVTLGKSGYLDPGTEYIMSRFMQIKVKGAVTEQLTQQASATLKSHKAYMTESFAKADKRRTEFEAGFAAAELLITGTVTPSIEAAAPMAAAAASTPAGHRTDDLADRLLWAHMTRKHLEVVRHHYKTARLAMKGGNEMLKFKNKHPTYIKMMWKLLLKCKLAGLSVPGLTVAEAARCTANSAKSVEQLQADAATVSQMNQLIHECDELQQDYQCDLSPHDTQLKRRHEEIAQQKAGDERVTEECERQKQLRRLAWGLPEPMEG
jgi:hypothetical protein